MTLLEAKIKNTNFQQLFDKLGYKYFINGKYNLNIIGIRSNNTRSNAFDDYIAVEYRNANNDFCNSTFIATTDPGLFWLRNPSNIKGTAILVPGQYRGCWQIGKHQGKYEALVQCKPVTVCRDNNIDDRLDFDSKVKDTGIFGINIHKAGLNSVQVDKWSAGCQVFAKEDDFNKFMKLCHLQIDNGSGRTFTYTLINEKDLELV